MPWLCLEVRFWTIIPNYQAKLWKIYSEALVRSAAESSADEVHSCYLQVSVFLGQAGLYRESELLLDAALMPPRSPSPTTDEV